MKKYINSLEIAKIQATEHNYVLKKIRKNNIKHKESFYVDKQNKERPFYLLNKDQALDFYDYSVKNSDKLLSKIEELENPINTKLIALVIFIALIVLYMI